MDFNKYVYPTAPKFKSFITCSCGKSLNLNDYYNFCPNCGIKCIKKSEELERHEREKESYNYQVNEIRKAFIEDVLVDLGMKPNEKVCFTIEQLIEYFYRETDKNFKNTYRDLVEFLDCK